MQDRLALFSVFTPFAEPRQDDYQIFRYTHCRMHSCRSRLHRLCGPFAHDECVCDLAAAVGLRVGCAADIVRWTYVDHAYGTGSRELAQAVWRDRDFSPLDRLNDEESYEAYVRSVVRWRVASYDPRVTARDKRIKWLDPQHHVPAGEAPLPEEQVEQSIRAS